MLITRPTAAAAKLSRRLEDEGAIVDVRPTIELTTTADPAAARAAIEDLSSYRWVLFTSRNGVRFFNQYGWRWF